MRMCDIPTSQQYAGHNSQKALEIYSFSPFRVIDIQQGCIAIPPPQCRYLALTYVWGDIQNCKNIKGNRALLETLGKLPIERLPQTLKDAIYLVAEIGERFLWVDSLCITQDDEESKAGQINTMGQIYSSTIATIVAHHGESAKSGLCGITPHIPRVQHREMVQNLTVANRMCLRSDFKWSTRAWTYQEEMLSCRLLRFTEYYIDFQSEFGDFYED